MATTNESATALGAPIDEITLSGFKSIRELGSFRLGSLNVLIGANGSGKSNFVSLFSLLRELVEERLELAVNRAGGADRHLYLGPKKTKRIEATLQFGWNEYQFSLEPTSDNRLIFTDERIVYLAKPGMQTMPVNESIGTGHSESKLKQEAKSGSHKRIADYVYRGVSSWTQYHFHDTSPAAAIRRTGPLHDCERLRDDGENLAAFLYRIREEDEAAYSLIVDTIRLAAPFFREFKLRPRKKRGHAPEIDLEWRQSKSDYPFHVSQLSDGTLRFMALATALLQPVPPATIVIDEPELGLHPTALDLLGSLIRQAAQRTQVIISTQSAALLNAFEPQQVVVVDRCRGESQFRRLSPDDLHVWLKDKYTLGEIWQKGLCGGEPVND
jgi:predicted ATPase